MEPSEEQVNEALPQTGLRTSPESVRQEKALCETPGTSRTSTRGSLRFGSLSHHSFFSRHNPHPHRVRHMQGLNGKPVCTVNDDWYGFTPLCPHPLIKSQVSVGGSRWSVFLTPEIGSDRAGPRADQSSSCYFLPFLIFSHLFLVLALFHLSCLSTELISECWREELKDLATKVSLSAAAETQQDKREKLTDEEVPRRKTQYSAQSGRIIPASSWGGKKRSSRTSHKRAQRWQTQSLEGVELKVLELLCQILQTDSLSMVQQWLLLASDKEKELVQGLLQQAMANSSSLTQQKSGPELLPLTSEDLPDHVFLSSSVSRRKSSSHLAEPLQDKPERIGEAEVLTLYPENT
ncbi:protein TBATA-like [Sinocyclocheilus anshuiensis]|uniref:protein TBATA-like n=1 Tax=Sinocyclocheilus anshuiensis TaxID=1608454 RepID=UPI0007B7FA2A|nr:PREDICTED: protein TBATA-like [Sinocyclocheilus anshuiensis]